MVPSHGLADPLGPLLYFADFWRAVSKPLMVLGASGSCDKSGNKAGGATSRDLSQYKPKSDKAPTASASAPPNHRTASSATCETVFAAERRPEPAKNVNENGKSSTTLSTQHGGNVRGTFVGADDIDEIRRLITVAAGISSSLVFWRILSFVAENAKSSKENELDPTNSYKRCRAEVESLRQFSKSALIECAGS